MQRQIKDRFKGVFWVFFVSFAAFAAFPTPSSGATAETFYENALRRNGINAFAATCQSAHETGFWTSSLWRNANNGAGIKADKNWIRAGRPTVRKKSQEVVGGKWTTRESLFRVYSSLDDFLDDYNRKICRDYPLASKNRDTTWGYFSALQKGRHGAWATSHTYFERMADKAIRLAPQLLGFDWRMQLLYDYKKAKARGLLSKKEIAIIRKKLAADEKDSTR